MLTAELVEGINEAIEEYETPFYLYDERTIRVASQNLKQAFSWDNKFKNYYAVKALPNPKILKILLDEDMGLDCSSLTELLIAKKLAVKGGDIMFSANDTPAADLKLATDLEAIINLDDISHLNFLESISELPDLLCFRYNPGNLIKGNSIIGSPSEAKFGMTKEQIFDAITTANYKGVRKFGLHCMVVSNNLDPNEAVKIVELMFDLASELENKLNIKLEFINLGGGIGIPYKPDQSPFDVISFGQKVKKLYFEKLNYKPAIFMECGRFITGPSGYLISKVIHLKDTYKHFVGLDASMHNLMRPGMYGAYHEISVLNSKQSKQTKYDVTGSLCENNDKFAIDRLLPEVAVGDVIVIHDAGAHGHAMGFNYNGKLRSAEILMRTSGQLEQIRRAEKPEDYFVTLI